MIHHLLFSLEAMFEVIAVAESRMKEQVKNCERRPILQLVLDRHSTGPVAELAENCVLGEFKFTLLIFKLC